MSVGSSIILILHFNQYQNILTRAGRLLTRDLVTAPRGPHTSHLPPDIIRYAGFNRSWTSWQANRSYSKDRAGSNPYDSSDCCYYWLLS